MELVLLLIAHVAAQRLGAAKLGQAAQRRRWQRPPLLLQDPPWDFAIAAGGDGRSGLSSGSECFDASVDHRPHMENNTRWVHWAVPTGPRPASGWPVFLMFEVQGWWAGPQVADDPVSHGIPETWSHTNASCGNGWRPHYRPPPPPLPAACTALLLQRCAAARASAAAGNLTACERCAGEVRRDALRRGLNCSIGRNPQGKSLNWVAGFCWQHHSSHSSMWWPITYGPFASPSDSIKFAFDGEDPTTVNQSVASSESPEADFPQAGLMWIQRVKQYLIKNGVAILILNPYMADTWDWDTATDWHNGVDRPFLRDLLSAVGDGSFPAGGRFRPGRLLDPSRVVVAGYSVGAQMASWMIQVTSAGLFPFLNISGAVMLSGGSHLCYRNNPRWPVKDRRRDPPPDPLHPALAQCAGCNASWKCGAIFVDRVPQPTSKCSNDYKDPKHPPCCQFCCPRNFTESWYHEDPSRYAKHPPTFLAQMSTGDKNADLCAAKNCACLWAVSLCLWRADSLFDPSLPPRHVSRRPRDDAGPQCQQHTLARAT
jgi:hypothetical protein